MDEHVLLYARHLATTTPFVPGSEGTLSVSVLGHGYNNLLYTLSTDAIDLVLKVYPQGRQDRMQREHAALSLLSSVDSVPDLVLGEPNARFIERPVLIYYKVTGSPLDADKIGPADLDGLAEIWATIHGTQVPNAGPLAKPVGPSAPRMCLDLIDRELLSLKGSLDQQSPLVHETLTYLHEFRRCLDMLDLKPHLWREPQGRLCQADSQLTNVVKGSCGMLYLVDWEHAGLMDPAYEIASFFQRPDSLQLSRKQRDNCIDRYVDRRGISADRDRIAVYLTVLPVQWVARLTSLLASQNSTPMQPWITPRSNEELAADLREAMALARDTLDGKLL